ncbi:hypothetical protein MVEN_00720000 [Mycena venus]|uniref:Uncharacterized protein n=1 Tax=Mycena venus TaxID=2733690 RepID=A0A8H7D5R9_9AGAR|nr:hypothetical protein MVEN_00720000 [Mycena venus]
MAHMLASLHVCAINRALPGSPPNLIWNVTAEPPSHSTPSNRAWVHLFEGLDFTSDMYFVGKVIRPPLTCDGCKSFGHLCDFCPFHTLPGWPSRSAPAMDSRGSAGCRDGNVNGGGNGNGGGRKNGNGNGRRPRKIQRTN